MKTIKIKLKELGFDENNTPKGIRRKNQIKKYFTEKEWEFLNSLSPENIFEAIWLIFHDFQKGTCKLCGKETKYWNYKNGYKTYCSQECYQKDKRNFFKESAKKFNVENFSQLKKVKEKKKETYLKKYGTESHFQAEEIKNKITQKHLEKYGVKRATQTKEILEKIKKTNIKKYGTENPMKSKEIQEKVRKTNRLKDYNKLKERADKNNLKIIEESFFKDKNFLTECKKCGFIFENNYYFKLCPKCYSYSYTKPHKKVIDFLNELEIEFEINKKFKFDNKQLKLDIFIPDKQIGIEINDSFWHSTKMKDKNYHMEKVNLFNSIGINVISIWDFDINSEKFRIWKSLLKSKLNLISNRIYARKCKIGIVKTEKEKEFLENNHLQGYIPSKIKLGLYFEDELVSLMTFGKSRFGNEFELLRFCNKKDLIVVGGAQKLFKNFLSNFEINEIISYADKDYVFKDNNLYLKLGFEYVSETPSFFYVKNGTKYNRMQFQKHKLKKFENYNENKTAQEILEEAGYLTCFNAGQMKFIYRRR